LEGGPKGLPPKRNDFKIEKGVGMEEIAKQNHGFGLVLVGGRPYFAKQSRALL
jgi:hypothetical protein